MLGPEGDRRERLADLVVQLASNSQPFLLLRGQRQTGTLVSLVLQPLEHLVERLSQLQNLAARAFEPAGPLARPQQVDPTHHSD